MIFWLVNLDLTDLKGTLNNSIWAGIESVYSDNSNKVYSLNPSDWPLMTSRDNQVEWPI